MIELGSKEDRSERTLDDMVGEADTRLRVTLTNGRMRVGEMLLFLGEDLRSFKTAVHTKSAQRWPALVSFSCYLLLLSPRFAFFLLLPATPFLLPILALRLHPASTLRGSRSALHRPLLLCKQLLMS